ncbi:MAG: hypothetical protein HQK69_07610 [Desulfamplus sp.]|nr:hypothetical protein [Desulfamplus sp.]
MGMTYWIHILNGRNMSKESDDHSMMYRLSEELDIECDKLGIPRLSSFSDFTDLELCVNEDEDESQDELIPDEETGYGYGIDDMQWFPISSGISCIEALRKHVADGWNPALNENDRAELIEEFDDCIAHLNSARIETGKFHLAVIM